MQVRNLAFDQIKGILIILVLIGHIVMGDMQTTPVRMVIYFFHMPLFLAITGYFIKQELLEHSIQNILIRYKDRLIIPFAFAFAFYHSIMLFYKDFLAVIIQVFSPYPYYHLWYIPAVILFILYLKFFDFLAKKGWKIALISLSAFFLALTLYFETYLQWGLHKNFIYKILGDKRFYYFFSYFAFGYLLAQYKHQLAYWSKYFFFAIIAGLLLFNLANFDYAVGFGKVLTNLGLIGFVIYICEYQKIPINQILAKIGTVSLPVYLWHAFPVLVLQKLPLDLSVYYGISLLFFVCLIAMVVCFEDKYAIINRIFYGKN